MTTRSKASMTLLNAQGVECKASDPGLMWMVLKPTDGAKCIEVGSGDRSKAHSALTFASDAIFLRRYAHSMTEFGKVHMYASAEGSYAEEAGVMLPGHPLSDGDWAMANVNLGWDGEPVLSKGRILSKTLDLTQVERLRNQHADLKKIASAKQKAEGLVKEAIGKEAKHTWGLHLAKGLGFRVYVAHFRPFAMKMAATIEMSFTDLTKALEMRNDAIQGLLDYQKWVKPLVAEVAEEFRNVGDQGDGPEPAEGTEPESTPVVTLEPIVLRLVGDNNRLTSETVNVLDFTGKVVKLMNVNRGVACKSPGAWSTWFVNPGDAQGVANWRKFAALTNYAVKVS